jgi:hypothetical protein
MRLRPSLRVSLLINVLYKTLVVAACGVGWENGKWLPLLAGGNGAYRLEMPAISEDWRSEVWLQRSFLLMLGLLWSTPGDAVHDLSARHMFPLQQNAPP